MLMDVLIFRIETLYICWQADIMKDNRQNGKRRKQTERQIPAELHRAAGIG